MEIIEKIQLTFDDVDEERMVSIARTCSEMVTPLRLHLAFCRTDQTKLKTIQSKQKEAREKIKEMGIKAHFAVDLFKQHLDIAYKKQSSEQPFNVPLILDDSSIFKVEILRFPDSEDFCPEADHLECALRNAQKVCEESILWTIFYSELEDMELEVKEEMSVDRKKELAENISSAKEYSKEIKMEKWDQSGLPSNGTLLPGKYLQLFKNGAYELFSYLQTEYTLDDLSPVAKYSYIYRFLVHEQLIMARSQSKYIEFIKETQGIHMSKILPVNAKFNDDIHPLLSRLKSDFERGNKKVLNGIV